MMLRQDAELKKRILEVKQKYEKHNCKTYFLEDIFNILVNLELYLKTTVMIDEHTEYKVHLQKVFLTAFALTTFIYMNFFCTFV